MESHTFEIISILINGICALAFWSVREQVRFVRELLTEKHEDSVRRIEVLEARCEKRR